MALAERLPERPRLLDLGAGTGSLFRYLAPILGRPQSWVFADADEALLQAGLGRIRRWAEGRGLGARTVARVASIGADSHHAFGPMADRDLAGRSRQCAARPAAGR